MLRRALGDMHQSTTTLLGRVYVGLITALCVAALASASACGRGATNVHETEAVKGSACISCHSGAYQSASNPLHANKIQDTCQECHTTKQWSPAQVQNHKWWPLQNKHVDVKCAACHTTGFREGETSKECQGCHRKDYDDAKNPKHSGLPLDCAMCHADVGFRPSSFAHPWPLEGAHAATPCAPCHAGEPPAYKGTPKGCLDCHRKDYDSAKNPLHAGLSAACTDCHTTRAWKPTSYVHVWPLQGKHVVVPCNSCHTGNPPKYKGTTTDCYGCHQVASDASTFPNHKAFPHACLDCHAMSGWKPALAGLHPEAKFPLATGAHADARIRCQDCHILAKGASTAGQNTDCINCHMGSHLGAPMDVKHADLKVPAYPLAPTTTNYCLACHLTGKK